MKCTKYWAAVMAMVALSGVAQAGLVNLGDGTVMDTNTNLIWLRDWSTSGVYDRATQVAWADGLNFAGSTDWTLPTNLELMTLFGAYGSLYHARTFNYEELAFTNLLPYYYWTGSLLQDVPPFSGESESFNARYGTFQRFPMTTALPAVAVRPADVTVPVSEPKTLTLALLSLGAMVAVRRRRPL
jgi:hypothetical protein